MKEVVVIFALLFVSCKINQTKNGVPVGRWKYVTQMGNTTDLVKAKYDRLGNEKGVWNYYNNKKLYRTEKYYYPFCVNVLYHENGNIAEVGKSISSNQSWTKYGTWYVFDTTGMLTDSITY